jgi:glycerol-3-phosphate dehydrogenase
VLRVLREAQAHGGVAVNYMAVATLVRAGGQVCGARLEDATGGGTHEVRARLVISATGAWADQLRGQAGAAPRLRPLRGSHLVLPAWRLPLSQAISLMHPADGRPVFAFPWEGVTLAGTTDVDHTGGMAQEAAITRGELDYLMAALRFQFPQLDLIESDIIATYAGVRPIIGSGHGDTETLWAELRWAARAEAVERLEDLLLRRTRLGLQLRGGGAETMVRIRAICQAELGWSDARWDSGQAAYLALWNTHYSLPPQQD